MDKGQTINAIYEIVKDFVKKHEKGISVDEQEGKLKEVYRLLINLYH